MVKTRELPDFETIRDIEAATGQTYASVAAFNSGAVDLGEGSLHVTQEGHRYVQAADDASDHDRTANGYKFYIEGDHLRSKAFGLAADDDGTGTSGTDDAATLTLIAEAATRRLANGQTVKITLQPGFIRSSGKFAISTEFSGSVVVNGAGANIIYTSPQSLNDRIFEVRNTGANLVPSILVENLIVDINRDGVRTGGMDNILVGGARSITVRNCTVPRADNMGISINRGVDTAPDYIEVSGCVVGSGTPSSGGIWSGHGAVGDTGIWVLNYGTLTRVIGNSVHSTGDDGIALAENGTDPARAHAVISDNVVTRNGASGIKSSAISNIIHGNRIDTTLNQAIALTDQDVGAGGCYPQSAILSNNYVKNGGGANAASLAATSTITQSNPRALQLDNCSGNVKVIGCVFEGGSPNVIEIVRNARAFSGLHVSNCTFLNISGTGRVFATSSATAYTCGDVVFEHNDFVGVSTRLFNWECALDTEIYPELRDGPFTWASNTLSDCDFSALTEIMAVSGASAAAVQNVRIEGDKFRRCTQASTFAIDISDADKSEVTLNYWWDGALFNFPVEAYHMLTTGNVGVIGAYPPVVAARSITTGEVLMRLDAGRSHDIRVVAEHGTANRQGVALDASWSAESLKHVSPEDGITVFQQDTGDQNSIMELALDASTAEYATGTDLLVQASGTWSNSCRVRATVQSYSLDYHLAKVI